MRPVVLLMVVALSWSSPILPARAGEAIEVGAPLPEDAPMAVVDLGGATMDLRRMLAPARADARASLLVFWASWCQPCIHEIPTLKSLQDFHRERGLRIVGVGVREGGETIARIGGAALRHKLNYDVVFDAEGEAVSSFGLTGIPWAVLFDGEGIVRWSGPSLPRDIDTRIRAALEPQEERGRR